MVHSWHTNILGKPRYFYKCYSSQTKETIINRDRTTVFVSDKKSRNYIFFVEDSEQPYLRHINADKKYIFKIYNLGDAI